MRINIRQATADDLPILLEFEKGIADAERPFDPTLKIGEIHYYDLLALIQSPDAAVFVAEVDNELAGSGYGKIMPGEDYQTFDAYVHLGFMYVKPAFRGRGINRQILSAIKDWAKLKNISELRLEVYDENEIAKNAYLKAGFEPNLLKMRMEI